MLNAKDLETLEKDFHNSKMRINKSPEQLMNRTATFKINEKTWEKFKLFCKVNKTKPAKIIRQLIEKCVNV